MLHLRVFNCALAMWYSLLTATTCRANSQQFPGVALQHATNYNRHRNISELLDSLLHNYDNSLRPGLGGPPILVYTDIVVRSMGPVSEMEMTYSMDCYFRQTWRDERLAHGLSGELALSVSMLQRIWKPDTYFFNGKNSYVHTITTPNKLIRLSHDGTVLYSARMTIKASCPMELSHFPMDTQNCPLKLGSFAYDNRDVLYRWNAERQIAIAPDMKMSQFDLIGTPVSNITQITPSGNFSMLIVGFRLRRHMGNFLIQVYGPCILLVVLSWVSFWLNREATADRVSLGVTTVLTMTFLGLEARATLPKVPYPTALDYFVFYAFAFIFATVVQFAVVHYFTKRGYGELYYLTEDGYSCNGDPATDDEDSAREGGEESEDDEGKEAGNKPTVVVHQELCQRRVPEFCMDLSVSVVKEGSLLPCTAWENNSLPSRVTENHKRSPSLPKLMATSTRKHRNKNISVNGRQIEKHECSWGGRINSVSRIDSISRFVFPFAFAVINFAYWYWYLALYDSQN